MFKLFFLGDLAPAGLWSKLTGIGHSPPRIMNVSGIGFQSTSYTAGPRRAEGAPSPEAAGSGKAQASGSPTSGGMTPEELAALKELKARDQEVRSHEQAHLNAAGGLATSGSSFTYQKGPDGVRYAVGGEVQINTSPGRTPEETLQRAKIIQAAALAPAEPSGQDLAVAAQARKMELQARQQLALEAQSEAGSSGSSGPGRQQNHAPTDIARHYASSAASSPSPRLDTWS